SGLDGVYPPAESDQSIRRSELETPIDHIAIRLFHIDVDPCMWVGELNLRHGSVYFHWLVHIEFGSESMMPRHPLRRQNQNQSRTETEKKKFIRQGVNLKIFCGGGGVQKFFCSVCLPSAHANSGNSPPFDFFKKAPATFHGPVNS